ncbi:MAG: hypothetical protein AAFU49_08780 [Pseudomonadota bacterium]
MTRYEIDAALFRARMPAIAMPRTQEPTDPGTPGCWFGGEPTLPAEYDWPIFTFPHKPYRGFQVPMHFYVQIKLQYLPRDRAVGKMH